MPPDPTRLSSPEDCLALYERGFPGFYPDPAAEAALMAEVDARGGYSRALGAISHFNLYGAGEGVLSLPYLAAMRMYPDCLPGGSQARGDCVSWSLRSASLVSYCASLLWGDNTERFAPPIVSDAARQSGVFATETFYWFRGHSGEGWNCGDAARIALTKSGMMVRRNYPDIGIDLEEYSGATAGKWGAASPPAKVVEVTSQHLLSSATVCKTWPEVRDMLANGFALATCGSEAFERSRDENGVCRRSNSVWRHAMSFIAADGRISNAATGAKDSCSSKTRGRTTAAMPAPSTGRSTRSRPAAFGLAGTTFVNGTWSPSVAAGDSRPTRFLVGNCPRSSRRNP